MFEPSSASVEEGSKDETRAFNRRMQEDKLVEHIEWQIKNNY